MAETETFVLEPGSGRAVPMSRGTRFRIEQTDGGQVADVVAFALGRWDEWLSCSNTIMYNMDLRLKPGSSAYSNRSRAMLTVVADTVQRNNLFLGGCSLESYQFRFGCDHANCRDILKAVLAAEGGAAVEPPPPLNFFMEWPLHEDGSLEMGSSPALPGDFVEIEAAMDIVFAISVCPQDLTPTNGFHPTPLRVTVGRTEG